MIAAAAAGSKAPSDGNNNKESAVIKNAGNLLGASVCDAAAACPSPFGERGNKKSGLNSNADGSRWATPITPTFTISTLDP